MENPSSLAYISSHAATVFDNRLWICGGIYSGWFGQYAYADFYVYDFAANYWFKLDLSEKELGYHSDVGDITLLPANRSLYIFGGCDSRGRPTSDIYRFAPVCTTVSIVSMRQQLLDTSKHLEETNTGFQKFENRLLELENTGVLLQKELKSIHESDLQTLNQMREQLKVSENLQKEISTLDEELRNVNRQNGQKFEKIAADYRVLMQKMNRTEAKTEGDRELRK
ncbi:kelch repeat-containing protein [Cardiosporidium cionae]|uniref:Kelch repeat-containing protein n=1 Tax=Cardiosporidium cionae TaxID=476202 RepID=A0ABQ7J9Y5_9APIC|nr:kelch repeat-containing protein [Cardiosporidium cionae]|eukprot:KAF8820817.1 kelch repeat-containing protein [Cardiosporidium cionae]